MFSSGNITLCNLQVKRIGYIVEGLLYIAFKACVAFTMLKNTLCDKKLHSMARFILLLEY